MVNQIVSAPRRSNARRWSRNRRVQREQLPVTMSTPSGAVLFVLFLLLLCVNGWGCAMPSAPSHYSIDSDFPAEAQAVIHEAVAAWCDATGDCPEYVELRAERGHFALVDAPYLEQVSDGADGRARAVFASESGGNIRIASGVLDKGLDVLWTVAAHEYGHLCIEGHPNAAGVMASYEPSSLAIDAEAVEAWRAGCP